MRIQLRRADRVLVPEMIRDTISVPFLSGNKSRGAKMIWNEL